MSTSAPGDGLSVVYGTEGSPFVRKVLVCLAEKGIGWRLHEVNVFEPPDWFLELSPARRIPVIEIEGDALADSSAICGFLERWQPTPALYPSAPMAYGRTLWVEEYADTLLAARIGFGLLRTLVVAPLRGQPPDLERARRTWHEELPPLFDYLDGYLGDREYFVADTLSVADIAVAAQLAGLWVARVVLPPSRWPRLAGFMDRMLERPSFRARLDAVAASRPAQPFEP